MRLILRISTIVAIIFLINIGCNSTNKNSIYHVPIDDSISDSVEARYKRLKSQERIGRLVGVWLDEEEGRSLNISTGYKFIISRDNRLFVQVCNPNDETLAKGTDTMISPLATELRDDKKQYTDIDSPSQYYIIANSGDLLLYDDKGIIARCKKLFLDAGDYY